VSVATRQLQQHKKALFLDAFKQTGNITVSARRAAVDRSTYYRWCEHDDAFAAAARLAEQEAADVLEAEAWRRAVHGVRREKGVYHLGQQVATEVVTEYSDTLLIFLLKGVRPEKFRDRYDVTSAGARVAPLTVVVHEVPDRAG
jgi:hypothetical protein